MKWEILNERPLIRIANADSIEWLKKCNENQYDLAIVDPPYGIGFDGNSTVKGKAGKANTFSNVQHHSKKMWDSEIPSKEYFVELIRTTKNQIIWGGNYFTGFLRPSRSWVFWDKKITNKNNTNFSDGELAWTSFDRILRKFVYDWIGFGYLNNKEREKKQHPTQKPVALYRWCLKNYSSSGETILDTHGGSGSILLACYERGNPIDWIELDEEYYNNAKERFLSWKSIQIRRGEK